MFKYYKYSGKSLESFKERNAMIIHTFLRVWSMSYLLGFAGGRAGRTGVRCAGDRGDGQMQIPF